MENNKVVNFEVLVSLRATFSCGDQDMQLLGVGRP